jgi:hypothetical protein
MKTDRPVLTYSSEFLPPPPPPKDDDEANAGSGYTADQIEFMMAMDRYKRLRNRPFPTWPEVLAVAKSLGYRLVRDRQHEATESADQLAPPVP